MKIIDELADKYKQKVKAIKTFEIDTVERAMNHLSIKIDDCKESKVNKQIIKGMELAKMEIYSYIENLKKEQ